MLLMSPEEASNAIGVTCGGQAPGSDDPQLIAALRYMTPRLEGALNVLSLTRGIWVDHFYCSAMPCRGERPEQSLLLSNGFLVAGSAIITAPDGTVQTTAELLALEEPYRGNVDESHGVVVLRSWQRGTYSIAYSSGFEEPPLPDPLPPDYRPEDQVLLNVPDFIKGIVSALLVRWFRSVYVNPKFANKNISYAQVDALLSKEIYARVYEKYMRPRVAVTFSERVERGS
jgi:hypothetical protein